MSLGHAFLGLLEGGPRHGYDLKGAYDRWFGRSRPLPFGQVYATLARLLRDELVEVDGVHAGAGPERKTYAITDDGVAELNAWLAAPEKATASVQNVLYVKVVLAVLSGRAPADVLETQRAEHLARMRELTRRKARGDLADTLIHDHALFHLEADLRWLELATARLTELATIVSPPSATDREIARQKGRP